MGSQQAPSFHKTSRTWVANVLRMGHPESWRMKKDCGKGRLQSKHEASDAESSRNSRRTCAWVDGRQATRKYVEAAVSCITAWALPAVIPALRQPSQMAMARQCTWPGSSWRPSAREADIVATRPHVPLGDKSRPRVSCVSGRVTNRVAKALAKGT